MQGFEHEHALTLAAVSQKAVLPVIEEEIIETVPSWTETPPPCKQRAKCEFGLPWGRLEKFRSLRHVHPVVDQSVSRSCAKASRGKHVSNLPIGAMGTFQGL
jgi:hypothetical protein